jgi:hypothetical protein
MLEGGRILDGSTYPDLKGRLHKIAQITATKNIENHLRDLRSAPL